MKNNSLQEVSESPKNRTQNGHGEGRSIAFIRRSEARCGHVTVSTNIHHVFPPLLRRHLDRVTPCYPDIPTWMDSANPNLNQASMAFLRLPGLAQDGPFPFQKNRNLWTAGHGQTLLPTVVNTVHVGVTSLGSWEGLEQTSYQVLEQSEKAERLWVLVTFLARDPSTMTALQQEVQIIG